MNWMLTCAGVPFSIDAPRAEDVELHDVAHHLAQLVRFTGACRRPYSVAEHSLLTAEIAERELGIRDPSALLSVLMHDAHEAYMGDVNAVVKRFVRELCVANGHADPLSFLEDRLERTVRQRFGLLTSSTAYAVKIHQADLIARATEWRDLLPDNAPALSTVAAFPAVDWINLDTPEREAMTWKDWRQAFIDRAEGLMAAREVINEKWAMRT